MLTVTATNLLKSDTIAQQIDFFGNTDDKERERRERREVAVDEIRSKFGSLSITRASVIGNDIGIGNGKKRKSE